MLVARDPRSSSEFSKGLGVRGAHRKHITINHRLREDRLLIAETNHFLVLMQGECSRFDGHHIHFNSSRKTQGAHTDCVWLRSHRASI